MTESALGGERERSRTPEHEALAAEHRHIVPPLATRGRLMLTEAELVQWGEAFGRAALPPLVVGISGPLGAGKTTLVQAICAGLGVRDPVTSPTFALVHEYRARGGTIYHLDLYRLSSPDELTNIGWDDILASDAVVLVEWPERAGLRFPADAVPIELEHVADDPLRRILLAG
ncbi:MAG TPA: tRNA (adenosine(37)-N6)-threonylcarbamoyltransferase complex ATPase subunit type 1 TsaE [Gemmatimonadaceae bacterium]|nr:tRNA (adenosine(37)-N6)-threonylcarbamoyltransferase complex ATPase subunit type 1 TsaE [Gemmatimonadaceae bacterium]